MPLRLSRLMLFMKQLRQWNGLRKYYTINSSFEKGHTHVKLVTDYERLMEDEMKRLSPLQPDYDWDYLLNRDNRDQIYFNIQNRKGKGDIDLLLKLDKTLKSGTDDLDDFLHYDEEKENIKERLWAVADSIPNKTHPSVPIGDENKAVCLRTFGEKKKFGFQPKTVVELGERMNLLRTRNLTPSSCSRAYYFMGDLALLEEAIVNYSLDILLKHGFSYVTVPNLVHPNFIRGCGFQTDSERTQIYKLNKTYGDICLAGTSEIPLASLFNNSMLHIEELPRKLATVSRCYRAEVSDVERERGIYRVHQFTKVEMFSLTAQETGEESSEMLESLSNIQAEIFKGVGLHFKVLDMPTLELGLPAYRKFDVEAWMPSKEFYGEVSSASNCTDFQSRRLNIKYWNPNLEQKFVHSLNGTACALPRMIMAIMENYQNEDGTVTIPQVLRQYMDNKKLLERPKKPLRYRWQRTLH
ncbi:DgyrCDS12152 [Dimorphilus gyrociliatus]|uniref:serine--tRNA ligase n=1 Tax=Dimorphilus gyrociliatus TaxID=2664684 RepID=A0A7I8W5M7_9ANNE|nr:DgyrCDS12152 [Dimorphilus gyrociliatus]